MLNVGRYRGGGRATPEPQRHEAGHARRGVGTRRHLLNTWVVTERCIVFGGSVHPVAGMYQMVKNEGYFRRVYRYRSGNQILMRAMVRNRDYKAF